MILTLIIVIMIIWFYQLNLNRNLGKTNNPLNENDLAELVAFQKTFANSQNSLTVNIKDIDQSIFDLSVKNLNKKEKNTEMSLQYKGYDVETRRVDFFVEEKILTKSFYSFF